MGPDGIPPIVLSTCASALYKPLHYLFNMCLNSGYLPFEWKLHQVTPIYKSGDCCQNKNYRPISLLCNTSKVLERLIYNKIIDHIISYVKPVQFGFMPCRSTVQQLLLFMHDIFNSCQTDAIYLDISKAFDTVSHVHLLDKLASIDIVGDLWLWFRAYLINRFQYVSVNNHYSQLLPVESGVPQGSILGPLLFVVYVNDLPDTVLHSKMLLFADDTKCFRQIKSQTDQQILQTDLNLLSNWSTVSRLSFNPSKSVHISFNSKFSTSYKLNNCSLIHNYLIKTWVLLFVLTCGGITIMIIYLVKHIKCLVLFDIPSVYQIQLPPKSNYILLLSDHSSPTVQSYGDHI